MLSEKLQAMGIELPPVAGPFGAYAPVKRQGGLIYVAGQLPMKEGKLLVKGPVESRCTIEHAKIGARQCVINALGAVQSLLGPVDEVLSGVLRVGCFVCSDPGFEQQPQVANGASELLLELFGPAGQHVRAAVGVNVLPLGASVEVEFIFIAK